MWLTEKSRHSSGAKQVTFGRSVRDSSQGFVQTHLCKLVDVRLVSEARMGVQICLQFSIQSLLPPVPTPCLNKWDQDSPSSAVLWRRALGGKQLPAKRTK